MCATWPLYVKRPTGSSPLSARWTTRLWPSRHGFPAGPGATSSPTSPVTRTPSRTSSRAGLRTRAPRRATRTSSGTPRATSASSSRTCGPAPPDSRPGPRSRPTGRARSSCATASRTPPPGSPSGAGSRSTCTTSTSGSDTTWRISPAEFVEREIDFLAERFAGHPAMPSTGLKSDGGLVWTTGGGAGTGPVGVAGPAPELLGWLSGRRDGSGLTVEGGQLPVVPPL